MNCSTALHLLHLDREGERTPEEEAALRAHLLTCSACAREAARIEQLTAAESRMRRSVVAIPDLQRVRSRVLAELERADGGLLLWIERFLPTLERPAVRIAYGAIVLMVVGWFGVEQAQVHEARTALEVKVDMPRETRTGLEVVYTVDSQAAASAARAAQILPLATQRPTGNVEVTQSDLDELVRLTEHEVLRAMVQGPQSRARLAEVFHVVRSAVFVTIRFRTSGA